MKILQWTRGVVRRLTHCRCVYNLEQVMRARGQTIDHYMTINFTKGGVELALYAKKLNGRRGELIVFNFCPLCGRKMR